VSQDVGGGTLRQCRAYGHFCQSKTTFGRLLLDGFEHGEPLNQSKNFGGH
jgi:hypothetical protein